ncbi:hypothetical protein [Acuticoccus sediminis]|uniref:hypothetical protein n=1 Tax=Acuticoccus sediminis TaxID=2184697 RepID=UPI001CFCA02D|nr:hypothetical protein [Acuticoccus sediminis]
MAQFEVLPVPGYEDAILEEFRTLPLKCADGLDTMIGMLEDREPSVKDWCGLIAGRHELYAIPLPDCAQRRLIVSVRRTDRTRPRTVHGTLPGGEYACSRGRDIAVTQLGLINPLWEAAS